ncbi:hypothetical protein K435DRAFT_855645 [Dendrothele bispora CBS 962.96]|uniref:DUF6534 domain-containing protein n=1 Tax=Dendrothele bispora (strain CBS 962.96) TaxID=1314807 RepID=A0A4S8MBW4_DENBC|nr:hypothetical protein K435DRAFT_855645 [Dendrothele bispora CBS 962.96]
MTAERVYGPPLIGVLFNGILFGVLVVQAHLYFNWDRSGERWTGYLVTVLLVLETINTGIDFAMVYQGLFKNYGQLNLGIPFLAANPVITSSISTIVQIYYAWRIRILTKSNVLAGFILVLAWVSLASGICGSVFTALHPGWDGFDRKIFSSLVAWLTTTAICDIIIAIAMVFYLTTHKKDSMAVTKSVVNRIIILTIQTGVITSVAAVASILTFTLIKQATIQFIWDFSISKLYTNSLLSMLNAREEWSKTLDAQNDVENISDVSFVHLDGLADYSQEKSHP